MWNEYIKLGQNNFQFVKRNEDNFFKVIKSNDEAPIIENVVRWFNNGFFATRDEHFVYWETRDGVDLSYTEYYFKIYNNNLEIIFSETIRDKNKFEYLTDFIGDYLVIKGGVIDKNGIEFIPLKFNQEEAKHRLLLKFPLENPSEQSKTTNAINNYFYVERKRNFEQIDYTANYVEYLKGEVKNMYEIVYHLLLRRYSYQIQNRSEYTKGNGLKRYGDQEYVLAKFDLTYIITKIQDKLTLNERLTINYEDKYNSHYSYQEMETDLISYFLQPDKDILQERKSKLNRLFESINLKNFSIEAFKKVCIEKELFFKSATPFVEGRKVFINKFLELAGYQQRMGPNPHCIYICSTDILNKKIFPNFHLVQCAQDLTKFYVADSSAIAVDFGNFNYDDYIEILNLKKNIVMRSGWPTSRDGEYEANQACRYLQDGKVFGL